MAKIKPLTALKTSVAALTLSAMLVAPTTAFALDSNTASSSTSDATSATATNSTGATNSISTSTTSNTSTSGSNGVFSFSGTGTTVDDAIDDENLEFITITTDDNNVFYLVIDRSSSSENAYLLIQADEYDMASLSKSSSSSSTSALSSTALQSAISSTSSTDATDSSSNQTGTSAATSAASTTESSTQNEIPSYILIGIVAVLAALGGFLYMKFKVKPEREENKTEEKKIQELHNGATKDEDQIIPIETDYTDEDDELEDSEKPTGQLHDANIH